MTCCWLLLLAAADPTAVDVPRIDRDVAVASATRSPWIVSNGWRYLRHPKARYTLKAPPGRAVVAAAEAAVFGVDLELQPDASDSGTLRDYRAFLRALPPLQLPAVADITLIDDGSPEIEEVMNLLVRRNLLFRTAAPGAAHGSGLVIEIGKGQFTCDAARDPNEFAYLVRKALGDERRSIRVFGTEMAIVRLLGEGRAARVHVLNYNTRPLEGVRVRVRGQFSGATPHIFGSAQNRLEDARQDGQFYEFTLPEVVSHAVVDLR